MNKILLASALTTSLIMAGCSSSSSDTAQDVVDNSTVKVSGSITDSSASPEVALSGVTVAAKYGNASLNPNPVTTDASGNYSTTVLKNTDFYLSASKTGYITLNSAIKNLSADDTGNDVGLVTTGDAEGLIRGAFGDNTLTMTSAAWLAVDVVDANGNDMPGQIITTSVSPDGEAPDLGGPTYMAKYSATGSVTVTVNGGASQTGTLVNGEVLYMEFQQ